MADKTWEISGEVTADNSVALANIKVAFSTPSGATLKVFFTGIQDAGVGAVIQSNSTSTGNDDAKTLTITAAVSTQISFHGFVTTASTAGNVKFRWAQGISNIVGTTVRANSFMKMLRVK